MCFVPIGSVAIPSSREKLISDSPATERKLAELTATFKTALVTTLQKHIDAASTRSEAANVLSNWRTLIPSTSLPSDGFEYKGEKIPLKASLQQGERNMRYLRLDRNSGTHNRHEKLREASIAKFHHTLWIEGFTGESVSAAQAQKARKYIHDAGINSAHGFIFVETIPAAARPWIEHIVDYETVKAVKLPRDPNAAHHVQTNTGRIPGSYDLYTTELSVRPNPTGSKIQLDGVPAETFRHWNTPLYYAVGNKTDIKYLTAGLKAISPSGYTLVALGTARVEKFKRNFPAAQEAQDAIKAGYDAWAKSAGRGVALGVALQRSWEHRTLKYLSPGRIDDPELRRCVGLATKDLTAAENASKVFSRVLGEAATGGKLYPVSDLYPLMDIHNPEHTYIYLNAIYAARQSGQTL